MLYLLLFNFIIVDSVSHWVVTDEGKLESRPDSVFNLRQSHDLVALIRQEERIETLARLKEDMADDKDIIDTTEETDTNIRELEQLFYENDSDCTKAGTPLLDFDLYISTFLPLENKDIKSDEYLQISKGSAVDETGIHGKKVLRYPECKRFTDLDVSMHAFDHLEGIKKRANLTGFAELGLRSAIAGQLDLDQYGHLVYSSLVSNKTSWVLFNLAAFYWRVKGDAFQAIECLRRALHFSPHEHKDLALISLGNILHRARRSHEAAVVVRSAIDISPNLTVSHFTLANIYAVLSNYNQSVRYFASTLALQPNFESALRRKHAVLCHRKLEERLEEQHRTLQDTLDQLKLYQYKHELYGVESERLVSEQVTPATRQRQDALYREVMLAAGLPLDEAISQPASVIRPCNEIDCPYSDPPDA